MRALDLAQVRSNLTKPQDIRSLNAIRGIAALMVAVFHAPVLFGVTETLPHAYLAVDLFFVLSGFVMLHAYEDRIAKGLTLARFAQLRLARLYPLLFLATLAGFALWAVKFASGHEPGGVADLVALPLSLMLAPAPPDAAATHAAYPFCTQSWSIVWELAACGLLFCWVKWVRRGALAIAGVFAVGLAWLAFSRGGLDGGWTTPTFWIGALRAVVAFFAGVAVRQWTRRGPLPMAVKIAATAAAGAVLAYVAVIHATAWWADYATAVVGFPLIIAAAAQCRSRLLENPLGDRLGEASYSVYMLHNLTIEILVIALKRAPQLGAAAHIAFGLCWLGAFTALAWLSWRTIENPLRITFSRPDLLRWRRVSGQVVAAGA